MNARESLRFHCGIQGLMIESRGVFKEYLRD
jgi:hypothetical protein